MFVVCSACVSSQKQTTFIDVVVAATTVAVIQWSYFHIARSFSLDKCNNEEGNSVSPSQMTAVVLKLLPGLFPWQGINPGGGRPPFRRSVIPNFRGAVHYFPSTTLVEPVKNFWTATCSRAPCTPLLTCHTHLDSVLCCPPLVIHVPAFTC